MIYCIDSNIIVWGIKKQASPGQEEMIARAEKFFARVDGMEDFIVIPTVVLAEVLAPEPPTVRAKYLEILSGSFIVAPFDARAALKYAEILHSRFDEIKSIAAATSTPRQKMKVDHMVIATALVHGANCIYSTDAGLKAFAEGYIDVRDLPPLRDATGPTLSRQSNLFEGLAINEKKESQEDDSPF